MKSILLLVFVISTTAGQSAVTIGQIDSFESGALHNWARGNFATPPLNVSGGGPAGSGDAFMRLTSDGGGSNGKMLAFNNNQWTGNFTGIPSIAMDMVNLGTTNLIMRLSFRETTSMGTRGFVTNDSITLLPGSGWQHMVFDMTDLVAVDTSVSQAAFMTNVAQMRIVYAPLPATVLGDDITGSLGVDNITAVPETSLPTLTIIGGLAALRRRKR